MSEGLRVDQPDAAGTLGARLGSLTLPSSSATEAELKNVERALMHPPKKADWTRSVLSLLTAVALAIKSYSDLRLCLTDPTKHPEPFWSVALIVVSVVMLVFVIQELVLRLTEKHPFHEAALADVRKLIALQAKPDSSGNA